MIRITVLVDNKAHVPGLKPEHGLAFWVETEHGRVLFDTGQGTALIYNAQVLNIDLAQANAIALSHGHYDHTGGLAQAWANPARTPIYLHPEASRSRYRIGPNHTKEIGMSKHVRTILVKHIATVRPTSGPTEILPGIWLTGPIPRQHTQEELDREPFFLDPHGTQPDLFEDDQAMYLTSPTGVIVLLGCAHAGVINTLDYIQQLTGGTPIRAILGGMHLRNAGRARLDWTLARLREHNPQILAPMHCTGEAATTAIADAFGTCCRVGAAGTTFAF